MGLTTWMVVGAILEFVARQVVPGQDPGRFVATILLATDGNLGQEVLTADCNGERVLPIFSGEAEAEMVAWLWGCSRTAGGSGRPPPMNSFPCCAVLVPGYVAWRSIPLRRWPKQAPSLCSA